MITRLFLTILLSLVTFSALAQTNRNPITRGYLTTPLNANGQAITNLGLLTASNPVVTRSSLGIARRGEFIPRGMTLWDDFERSNTTYGVMTEAPSIAPHTGTNHQWLPSALFTTNTAYLITNGAWTFATTTNPLAIYATVDIGHKPTHFGARLRRTLTGLAGANVYPQFFFLSSPSSNSLDGAYHFGLTPGIYANIGFWQSPGNLTNIASGYAPTNWPGNASSQEFTYQVWIDGTNALFDIGGATFTLSDARFASFGGRHFTPEIYTGGTSTNSRVFELEVLAIWAGVSDRSVLPSNNVVQQAALSRLYAGEVNVTGTNIDLAASTRFIRTNSGSVLLSLSNATPGYEATVTLYNTAAAAITFTNLAGGSILWQGTNAPATSTNTTVAWFLCTGTNILGALGTNFPARPF